MDKFTRATMQEKIRGCGLDYVQARKATTQIIAALFESLNAGIPVELRGLGTLEVKERKAYKAHNPKTGEPLIAAAKRRVVFRPGRELKAALRTNPS